MISDNDRQRFITLALEQWADIFAGNVKASNAKVKSMDKLAKRWLSEHSLEAMLQPLLLHERESVKCAAAAHLTKYLKHAAAIETLKTLADNSKTLVASTAAAVLRTYGIPRTAGGG